jgi:hypothetical protein
VRPATVVTRALEGLLLLGILLPLELFPQPLVLEFVVLPPPQPLIMVEDDGAYCLFRAVLAYDVVVYPSLQVARIKLGDAEGVLVEDGAATCLLGGIIAASVSRPKVIGTARG